MLAYNLLIAIMYHRKTYSLVSVAEYRAIEQIANKSVDICNISNSPYPAALVRGVLRERSILYLAIILQIQDLRARLKSGHVTMRHRLLLPLTLGIMSRGARHMQFLSQ